jgi:KDO2-lipid IV(A) lauroyltransferase
MILYLFYLIVGFFAVRLPLWLSYRIARYLAIIKYAFSPRDRKYIQRNFKTVFPDKNESEINNLCRRAFINFAKYLTDFLRLDKFSKEYVEKRVNFKGRQFIDEVLGKGKGAIMLSAHIGNWELGAAILAIMGYDISIVALSHRYKRTDEFFIKKRTGKGINVIPLGMAVRQCFNVLRSNGLLGLNGDKDYTNNGISAVFFGKKTSLPKGPAAFSLKTGAPIIPTFLVRNENDTFDYIFEKPIYPEYSEDQENDLKTIIEKNVNYLEKYINKYPGQWCMFRSVWQ